MDLRPEPGHASHNLAEPLAYAALVEGELIKAADAPANEALLAKLASRDMAMTLELQKLQAHLARQLLSTVDDANRLLIVARVLRELGPALTSATKRVCLTLTTASSLHTQRRFLALKEGGDDAP